MTPTAPPTSASRTTPTSAPPSRGPYTFTFMAVTLRPEMARTIAEIFLQEQDWAATQARVIATNALQCRSPKTGKNIERELRLRLETLTGDQLTLLASAPAEDRGAIAWLAATKYSRFLFEFAADVLREKVAIREPLLRYSDFESFVETRSLEHPELAALGTSARNRVRESLHTMLKEAGLAVIQRSTVTIQRPVVSSPVLNAIISDNPRWLAGFLVTDEEIGGYRWV